MTTFSAALTFSLALQEAAAAVLSSAPGWASQMGSSIPFAAGLADGQFDLGYFAERTLADGATDSIDLSGALASPLGTAFVGIKLVALLLINRAKDGTANTTHLTVGGGSNKIVGLLDSHVIQPGGFALLGGPSATGIAAITAATGDILQIVNSAGAANKYQIAALGHSA